MQHATEHLVSLKPWYQKLVRPFLARQKADDKLQALDQDLAHLEKQSLRLREKVSACFLGSSGVGKSTLINAIVAGDEMVVPSGGVGPLTARELRIEYGSPKGLSAIYHEPARVWKLVFALEHMFAKELGTTSGMPPDKTVSEKLKDEDRLEIVSTDAAESNQGTSRAETYRKLATLIVTGSQTTDVPVHYVTDCLREVIGQRRIFGTEAREADRARLARLHAIFSTNEEELDTPACMECSSTESEFSQSIKEHATGFLAPLVAEFNVQWDSDLLKSGVQIIDLPGLGVAGDVYRRVTDDWIRKRAQIVVLVVDSRGIHESDADLLRSSGFLGRLIHSADDPSSDPVSLVIAVVRVDDIADSLRREDRSKTKLEHFREVQQGAKELLSRQFKDRLREAWIDGKDAGAATTKLEIIERLAKQIKVFPLSAIQYRQLLSGDDDDRPFISNPEDSGIPSFVAGLLEATQRLQEGRLKKFSDRVDLFDSEVRSTLRIFQARLSEANATSEQAMKLRSELDIFLQPLREELAARQGQFRSYLKDTLPSQIEVLVANARISASKDIRNYLRKIKEFHWATLRAAVRRGGTYHGSRHIEIPRDFAQFFEEPVAEIWGKSILKEVRQRTKEFADDCQALVKQVVEWGKSHKTFFEPEVIEAQLAAIKLDSRKLTTVGREMVDERREIVKNRLLKAIEEPIRRKCQGFVRRSSDIGTGVRDRMHELLDELVDDSLDAAVPAAQALLIENYQEMEREIRKVLAEYQDPIQTIVDTLMQRFEARENKQESKRRKKTLEELNLVLEATPTSA